MLSEKELMYFFRLAERFLASPHSDSKV